MNKEQQIEQMAKKLPDLIEEDYDEIYMLSTINYEDTAKTLVEAGYGHIPTAIKEFAEKLKKELQEDEYDNYWSEDHNNVRLIIDELLEEYKQ